MACPGSAPAAALLYGRVVTAQIFHVLFYVPNQRALRRISVGPSRPPTALEKSGTKCLIQGKAEE